MPSSLPPGLVPGHAEPISRPGDQPDMPQLPPQGHIPPPYSGELEDPPLGYYPPGGMQAAHHVFVTGREASFSSLPAPISLPLAVCETFVLNVPSYVNGSLATNAWRTRAIEYAIGAGCVGTVAFLLLLVQKRCFAHTVLQWKRATRDRWGWYGGEVETAFLHAFTVVLFPIVPGLGHSIRSLAFEGVTPEGVSLLANALFGVVPAIWVIFVVRWGSGLIASAPLYVDV